MVKIRLRRIGTKGRPFYRVVVTPSTAARNGRFIENLGTYNPVVKPTHIEINAERALHWLMQGAKPTETTAYLLNRVGVLEKYFEQRPAAKREYGFLDKRTAAMSVASSIDPQTKAAEPVPAAEAPSEPVEISETPVVETNAASEESALEASPAEASVESAEDPQEAK